jgi:glycosyltransferase involved in cell wall biosynthesis
MKKDSRIKKIQVNEKNSSAVISRNRLIEMADGDYAIWVDSDDEVNTNICSFATWLLHQEKFEIINFPYKINQKGVYENYALKQEKYKKCYGKDVWEYYITEKENPHHLWGKVIDVNLLKKMKA